MATSTTAKVKKPKIDASIARTRERAKQKRLTSKVEGYNYAVSRRSVIKDRESARQARQVSVIQQRQAVRQQEVTESSNRNVARGVVRAAPQAIPNTVSGESSPVAAGIFRIFAIFFLLSILFLVVSRGNQTGNAIQKVGFFLNNLTSNQPLIVKTPAK